MSLLRSRGAHARVTYVELFFELVFVFAVTQLSPVGGPALRRRVQSGAFAMRPG
jgi:low temperature requirement protein LtrA